MDVKQQKKLLTATGRNNSSFT